MDTDGSRGLFLDRVTHTTHADGDDLFSALNSSARRSRALFGSAVARLTARYTYTYMKHHGDRSTFGVPVALTTTFSRLDDTMPMSYRCSMLVFSCFSSIVQRRVFKNKYDSLRRSFSLARKYADAIGTENDDTIMMMMDDATLRSLARCD